MNKVKYIFYIPYASFILTPMWVLTSVMYCITEVFSLFQKDMWHYTSKKNFKGSVNGIFSGFKDNIRQIKNFY